MITSNAHRKYLALAGDPRVKQGAMALGCALGGFFLSGVALAGAAQPLAMGFVCSLTGWRALAAALGSGLGYRLFWGGAGIQGTVWAAGGWVLALILGRRQEKGAGRLLLTAAASLWVSAAGLAFQMLWGDRTPLGLYFLRVALAGGGTALYTLAKRDTVPLVREAAAATGVLALCRAAPLGISAAGILAASGSLPAAALGGLALDFAGVSPMPLAGVLCLGCLVGQLPGVKGWLPYAAPGLMYVLVMLLTGSRNLSALPWLILGGAGAMVLPAWPRQRTGETALAQMRLEIMAGVLNQTRQLFMEVPEIPVDEEAILARTRERACGSCPLRKTCRDSEKITQELLHEPLPDLSAMPCRKPGRLMLELRRSQEQLRFLRAQGRRRREYHRAVEQQYQFLGDFLWNLRDSLPEKEARRKKCWQVEVRQAARGRELENGDICQHFEGPGGKYYILLCDGMGTGIGAAQEAGIAGDLLRRMLTAGFPAEHALGSINSLCCLRGRAGAVTVDLVQVELDTGRAAVYKWGAAPSYLLRGGPAEKIGTAGPPPGLSMTQTRETVERLSLRRGEVLLLLSDGVDGEDALHRLALQPEVPLGEMAAKLLEAGWQPGMDDATVAAIRLHPST